MSNHDQIRTSFWEGVNKFRGYTHDPETIEILILLSYLRLLSIKSEQQNALMDVGPNRTVIIPSEFRWESITGSSNPCETVYNAIEVISSLNNGLFDNAIHSSWMQRFLDSQGLCVQLIEIVSGLDLPRTYLNDLSDIVDFLTATYSESLGIRGKEFYTPKHIINVIVELLNPQASDSIYDPACGTGGFLFAASKYVGDNTAQSERGNIVGRDINPQATNITRINALLHDIPLGNIKTGNSLLDPLDEIEQHNFDIVITNPPFALRHDEHTFNMLEWTAGINFIYGPPTRIADFNFIQHALSKLNNKGRAAIIIGLRPLFASGQEAEIRRRLLEADIIEAVITLPNNILPQTGAPSAILIFNKDKSVNMQGKVLFIRADNEFEQLDRSKRIIGKENQQKIIKTFRNKAVEPKFSSIVAYDEIARNEYQLIPTNYVGTDEVNIFLGTDVEDIKIDQIGIVRQGTKLARGKGVNAPIIQGRDLSNPFLLVGNLTRKDIPANISEDYISRIGDILIQRIGETPKAILVEEDLSGIAISDTVYIIRPTEVDSLRDRYIVEYINSDVGQAQLLSGLRRQVIPTLNITVLRNFKVPIPNQSIIEFIKDLHDVESTLTLRLQKSKSLRSQLFSIEDVNSFNQQLQQLGVELQVLKQSLLQSDDINFQIRNYFPYVLSFAYRSLDAIQNEAQLYKEQLRVAENILAFLGSVGLALVVSTNKNQPVDLKEFNYQKLRNYWQGGISPGDWQDMASRSGAELRLVEQNVLIAAFISLWFKGRGTKQSQFARLLQELITKKNDFKHDRGPQAPNEYIEGTMALGQDLKACLQELALFVQHPMRFIEEADVDWRSRRAKLKTLVYVGDHPGLRRESISVSESLPKDKLYIEVNEGHLLPLYPLISVHYCSSCKTRETYFIDRWDPNDGKLVLKSFERGHTHSNNTIIQQVGDDLKYWIESFFPKIEPNS